MGEPVMIIRKQKNLSQSELDKRIGTPGDVIGRYQRGVITPWFEVIMKMGDEFQVPIDNLVGKTNSQLDRSTLNRKEDIGQLPDTEKAHVFKVLDELLRYYKTQRAYS